MKFTKYIQYLLMALAVPWALTAFIACTDDNIKIQAEVVLPSDVDLLELEQYSYAIPFEIKSDSEWEIDFDFGDGRDICYVYPESGTGNATVKICVLDNWTDDRREGNMYITFPKDESKNQTIKLRQKCNLDRDDNLTTLNVGDRIYAVGYGYNYLGEYASEGSVSECPIVRMQEIKNKETYFTLGGITASYEAKTYSGSSVTSLMNELSADAKFGGKYLGFKGEVGATFGMTDFKSNNHEYAITYVEVARRNAHLEMNLQQIIDNMTDEAYEAINGLPHEGKRGKKSTKYPATEEGFKHLVKDYGTHLVKTARLGGRLKYSMIVDISKVKGSYDLKAYANCSYGNKYVNTSAKVNDNLKSSYENNSKNCKVTLLVQGGSKTAAGNLTSKGGDNDKNIKAWETSLDETQNQVLVGLDTDKGLIPLYDLVDQDLTLKEDGVDGKERYRLLKAYLTGESLGLEQATANILDINMDYETGTATHMTSIPLFNGGEAQSSLIKEIRAGGQAVAQVCEEYIPVIDKTKRVTVIYPIISDNVKYNMGYFIGDDTHKPAKVCWEGEKATVTECSDEPYGAKKELYLRGSSFLTSCYDNIVEGTVSDYKWPAPGYNGSYNYPLVKIFNRIWIRENYKANRKEDGDKFGNDYNLEPIWGTYNGSSQCFYSANMVLDRPSSGYYFAPRGWRVPYAEDFLSIINTLTEHKLQISKARAFYPDSRGGILGFHLVDVGCRFPNAPDVVFAGIWYPVISKDDYGYDGFMVFDEGQESIGQHWFDWDRYIPVRLVQDIE